MAFVTTTQAEVAFKMLRRFAPGVEYGYDRVNQAIQVWGSGLPDGGGFDTWESLAEFLLARQEQPIIPVRFVKVKGYLDTARVIVASQSGNRD